MDLSTMQREKTFCDLLSESSKESETLKLKGITIGHLNIGDIMSLNKLDEVHEEVVRNDFHVFGISGT